MTKRISILFTVCFFLFSCNDTLQCERHFIPNGFIGKVKIYFDKKDGQEQFDKDGCIVYKISANGECFSALAYKTGWRDLGKTIKYFEVISKSSVEEIPEYEKYEFLQDTMSNKKRKYVFFISSGFENPTGSNPNYTIEYAVDSGKNFKKH